MNKVSALVAGLTLTASAFANPTESAPTNLEFKVPVIAGMKAPQVTQGTRDALNRYNTIYGATGLVFIPTAYVAPQRAFGVSAFFANDISGPAATYGLIQDVEIGGAWLDFDGTDDEAVANAKVRLVPANFDRFEVGVGVLDIVDAIDQTIYVVGSFDLVVPEQAAEEGGVAFRGHVGIGTGYFNEKPFGGLELLFSEGFSVIGEYDTKTINAAFRYQHDENFSLQGGVYSNSLMFGMNYLMRF